MNDLLAELNRTANNGGGQMSASKPTSYPVGTIAKLLLLSERRVQQLTKEGIIPRSERGRYELVPAVQGYIRYLQEHNITGNSDKAPVDFYEHKARLTKAQADLAELNLQKARAEVAPIDQIERSVSKAFAEVRAGMRNIPGRVVTQLIGETDERRFKSVMLGEIDEALNVLAEANMLEPEETDDDNDNEDENPDDDE